MTGRYLIVNADDFGQSPGINRGTIEAHERGIVTSASLMVHGIAAAQAAEYVRSHPRMALGWHFDAGEWSFEQGQWVQKYEIVPLDDPAAVRAEAQRQLEIFRRLVGRDPTHIDSHQHVHLREPARPVLREIAEALELPLRHACPIRYCGSFYGQTAEGQPLPGAVSAAALIAILEALPEGWTELGCHPGKGRDLETMYSAEREQELEALCDPAVRLAIESRGIMLRSFHEVSRQLCELSF